MPTIQVDGNDLFAVYKAAKEAIERARTGGGPSFIECVTYRLGDHTTADDARATRDPKEVEAWLGKDPLIRLRKYLESKQLWTELAARDRGAGQADRERSGQDGRRDRHALHGRHLRLYLRDAARRA